MSCRAQRAVFVVAGAALSGLGACRSALDLGDDPPGPCLDAGTECAVDGGRACVDLASDPAHCGSCDGACATGLCVGGACCEGVTPRDCGGECVDLARDPDHCGACGARCATGLCAAGACCEVGQRICNDGDGVASCVDPTSDAAHCGDCDHGCASGLCLDGRCCEDGGSTVCEDADGASCVDLVSDPDNCGQCGRACACRLGECCEQACGKQCVGPYGPPAEGMGPKVTHTVRLVDLDGDGFDDLVAANRGGDSSLWVYWGNPDGLGVASQLEGGDRLGASLTFGDVDEDGHVDIVGAVQSDGAPTADEILVRYGDPDRTFTRREVIDEPANPVLMTLLHVDADEHLDLVMRVPDSPGWKTAVRMGDGAGGFGERRDLLDYGTLSENDAVVGGDLDGDGRDELVETRSAPSNEILVHHFTDDGAVDDARDEVRTLPDGALAYTLALRDTDSDAGRLPNIVAFEQVFEDGAWTSWRVWGLRDERICMLALVHAEAVMFDATLMAEIMQSIGDFDADGLLDLAALASCEECVTNFSVHLLHFGGR